MPLQFHCAGCNGLIQLDDSFAGRAVRCGRCQTVVTAPAAFPPAPPPEPFYPQAVAPAPAPAAQPLIAQRTPHRRRAEAQSSGVKLAIFVSGGLVALIAVVGVVSWLLTRPAPEPPPPEVAVPDGKFTKPAKAAAPTSYLRASSPPGDFIGGGQNYQYAGQEMRVSWRRDHVAIDVGGWNVEFAPPQRGTLVPAYYPNARRYPFNDEAPGINFSGNGRGCNQIAGNFVVWELQVRGNEVVRLAVDFEQRCENVGPPLRGSVRFNSNFQ